MARVTPRSAPAYQVTGDTGAKVAGFNGATQYTPSWAKGAIITLVASAAAGNNTMQLQFSYDGGATFLSIGSVSTALTGAGNASLMVYPTNLTIADATPVDLTITGTVAGVFLNTPLPPIWRILHAVPTSITITNVHINYLP